MLPFAWVQVAFLWVRCSLNLGAFCSKKAANRLQNCKKRSKGTVDEFKKLRFLFRLTSPSFSVKMSKTHRFRHFSPPQRVMVTNRKNELFNYLSPFPKKVCSKPYVFNRFSVCLAHVLN